MKATLEEIIGEKNKCCKKVQSIIDKHCKASLTEMKIRNLLQIVLRDELHPTNDLQFFKDFSEQYCVCSTIEEMKKALVDNLKKGNSKK